MTRRGLQGPLFTKASRSFAEDNALRAAAGITRTAPVVIPAQVAVPAILIDPENGDRSRPNQQTKQDDGDTSLGHACLPLKANLSQNPMDPAAWS